MNFEAARPIWMQVADQIKADIVTGRQPPGGKLPGSRDLALQYTINPNTAARVYQELEKEGVVETRHGMGTYVTEDAARIACLRDHLAQTAARQYLKQMAALGFARGEAAQFLEQAEQETEQEEE